MLLMKAGEPGSEAIGPPDVIGTADAVLDLRAASRQSGSESAPAARMHLAEMLEDPRLADHDLRQTAAEALAVLDLLVTQVRQLEEALASRIVIEQAKGLLMSRGITDEEAFEMLKTASQTRNRKLREVAADVIRTRRTTAPILD